MRSDLERRWWLGCLAAVLIAAFQGRGQTLEDPPKIITVQDNLSESEDDHVEAAALFAHGRVLLQRRELADALRRFQRAWRFDQDLVSIMTEIVPLTVALKREDEATRYALIAAKQQEVPEDILLKLAALLAERDQVELALSLYLKCPPEVQNNLAVQFEIGRLARLAGQFAQSADAFADVWQRLENDETDRNSVPANACSRNRKWSTPYSASAFCGPSGWTTPRRRSVPRTRPSRTRHCSGCKWRWSSRHGRRDRALEELDKYFDSKSSSAGMAPYELLGRLLDGPDAEGPAKDAAETAPPPDQPAEDNAATPSAKPSPQLLDRLRALSAADPDNAMLGYFVADRLRRADQLDEVRGGLREADQAVPAADGYVALADIYFRQRSLEPLVTLLGEAAGKTSSLEPLAATLAPLMQDAAARKEMADIARAIAQNKSADPPLGTAMALALLEVQAGDVESGGQFLEVALGQSGPGKGQFAVNYAFALLRQEQPKRAAEVFERVPGDKLLPDKSAELYYYLAGARALAEEPDQALEAARKATELSPASPLMAGRVAWTLYQIKRTEEAKQAYLALLDRFDADHSSSETRELLRDARLLLSNICVEQNQLDEAEEWLQQVLDEFPEDVGALNDLGYLWCDRGKRLHRSLAMVQTAVAADPDNVAYRDSLGWALFRLQRYDEALAELQKAAAGESADGVVLDHLGDAYWKTNRLEDAIKCWKQAAEAFEKRHDSQRLAQTKKKLEEHAPQ